MILTDYYRFEKIALKSKMRMDCTVSTRSYEPLEEKRMDKASPETATKDAIHVGDLTLYYGQRPAKFQGDPKRKTDNSLTVKSKNLSSVYVPDIESNIAYGDVHGTTDAIILVFRDFNVVDGKVQAGAVIELFIARGKGSEKFNLYTTFVDGVLDSEADSLREQAERMAHTPNDKPL